jgi:hypothetical protein
MKNREINGRVCHGTDTEVSSVRRNRIGMDHSETVDPGYHAGWSVMARGIAEGLDDRDAQRFANEPALRPWGLDERPGWVRIVVDEITGRRIVQARTYDPSAM